MKVVVFAYHNMGIVGLKALMREGFEITAVFSHRDDPDENRWFASVVDWAKQNRIAVFCPDNVNLPQWVSMIGRMSPDAIFSFYYRNLICDEILNIPPCGAYNLHGSLLPAYRGRCPVNWVLIHGERKTGVTLHHMIARADAGDIVGRREVAIDFEDTAHKLFQKLCAAADELLAEVLPLIRSGKAPRIKQDIQSGSYFGGRRPEDGKIEWSWPSLRIYNLIRAVTEPYPGAFSYLPDGEKLTIWWAVPERQKHPVQPSGAVYTDGHHVYVSTADGRLRLEDVQTAKGRLRGEKILKYFQSKKGLVLQ